MVAVTLVGIVMGVFAAGCAGQHADSSARPRPRSRSADTLKRRDRDRGQRGALDDRVGWPWRVAMTTVTFTDMSRATRPRGTDVGHAGRRITTVLRWPVAANGRPVPGRLPLVVFAHGYAVQTSTYAALLDDVAAAGSVVAAPEFPGESAALPGAPDEADLANEPCDVEFVANTIERAPPPEISDAILAGGVVFVGHSDGATAVAAAAYQNHSCAGPSPVAVVALSVRDVPIDLGPGSQSPLLLAVTGTADQINPEYNTVQLFHHVRPPAWLLTVDDGTHLGTFTTDPVRQQVSTVIAAFIRSTAHDQPIDLRAQSGGRLHLTSR